MAAAMVILAGFWAVPGMAEETPRGYDAVAGYQYLELGVFPQTLDGGQEPILWRVLAADENTVFLVSEYVLLNHRIHYDDVAYERNGGDFQTTEMFAYLNGPFLTNFTAAEQTLLLTGDDGALVTLLSRDDLNNKAYGFTGDNARRGMPTAYALQNGLFQYSNGSSPYWTRTQSASHAYGCVCTKQNGNMGYIRVVVQNEGLRPAITLNAGLLAIEGGSGTLTDPFEVTSQEGFKRNDQTTLHNDRPCAAADGSRVRVRRRGG